MSFTDRNDKTGTTMDCPACGSVMASYQTMDGAFFICGGCGLEISVTEPETLEE